MLEAGVFGADARVELIDGTVMDLDEVGPDHAATVQALAVLLRQAAEPRAVVAIECPVVLDDHSEPLPDLVVVGPTPGDSPLAPADLLLLVEVSSSPSLDYDLHQKAPLYARAGVRDYWVTDLEARTVTVMRSPSPSGYRDRTTHRGGPLAIVGLDGAPIAVEAVFS